MKLFSVIGVLALFLLGNAPQSAAYQEIFAQERERALDLGRLAAFLESADPNVAARAALALGRIKQPAAVPLLSARLAAADPGVRAMTVYALGLLVTPQVSAAPFLRALNDESAGVRVAACDALRRLLAARPAGAAPEPEVLAGLAARAHLDPSGIVRGRAAVALAGFGKRASADQAAAQLVHAFAREPDATVRWHIMWSVYRAFAALVPREFLERALASPDELVRLEAVRAYGKLGAGTSAATLEPLLVDPSWRVQEQAHESIRLLRGEKLTEHLTSLPRGVHVPPAPSPLTSPSALPRAVPKGSPGPPGLEGVRMEPLLDVRGPAALDGPLPGPHPAVRIRTTQGNLVVRLYPEWAPNTVANFLKLTNRGYYDGLRWFRVVPDFVVQTGDPHDNGEGDAGYTIPAEENPLEQRSGVLSMGLNYNDAGPIRDSAGAQFYITLSPQLHLDLDFTVFGEVAQGFDVLGRLTERDRMLRVEQLPDVDAFERPAHLNIERTAKNAFSLRSEMRR